MSGLTGPVKLTIQHRQLYRVVTRQGRTFERLRWDAETQTMRSCNNGRPRVVPWADVERLAPVVLRSERPQRGVSPITRQTYAPMTLAEQCELAPPPKRRCFTMSERLAVLATMREQGLTASAAGALIGASQRTVWEWHKRLEPRPLAPRAQPWVAQPWTNPIRERAVSAEPRDNAGRYLPRKAAA